MVRFMPGARSSYTNSVLAGYAYCAVAALLLLDRPPSSSSSSPAQETGTAIDQGIPDRAGLLKFLAGRQVKYLAEEEEDESEDGENVIEADIDSLSLEEGCRHVGYNGRWNKKADTCYCWWVAGTLAVSHDRVAPSS